MQWESTSYALSSSDDNSHTVLSLCLSRHTTLTRLEAQWSSRCRRRDPYLPFAFGKVLLDLGTDRLVDILVQSRVSSNPVETRGNIRTNGPFKKHTHLLTEGGEAIAANTMGESWEPILIQLADSPS